MAKQDKKEPLNDNEETKVKTLDNNKEPATEPVMPKNFTITAEGVNELVTCLNEVIPSKYVKQVIFNVINENLKAKVEK